jgi:glyoxylase I family protein
MAAPIKLQGIDHVVIRTRDAARAEHFYCDILGAHVERRSRSGLIQIKAGRSQIDLHTIQPSEVMPKPDEGNIAHFCLQVLPFDGPALLKYLNDSGVPANKIESRFGAQGRGPSIYVQDPDGNKVELKGPPFADQSGVDGLVAKAPA